MAGQHLQCFNFVQNWSRLLQFLTKNCKTSKTKDPILRTYFHMYVGVDLISIQRSKVYGVEIQESLSDLSFNMAERKWRTHPRKSASI